MKEKNNSKIMKTFTIKNIPTLDTCILGALEFLDGKSLPVIPKISKRTIVIGSGNAFNTGKIIFSNSDFIFANETNYKNEIKISKPKFAVLISASGGKHSIEISKYLKSKKIKTILFTNNLNASAKEFVDKSIIFPKQREPYTYNTSTYLSMILSKTKEKPAKIYNHLKKIKKIIPKNLSKYNSFFIIVPPEFEDVKKMFEIKFNELFGSRVVGRIYTEEEAKHAKTIVPSNKELFVGLGIKNISNWDKKRNIYIPLSKNAKAGEFLAVGYYLIGKIQGQDTPFFKKNILKYSNIASKMFGQKIEPIVE